MSKYRTYRNDKTFTTNEKWIEGETITISRLESTSSLTTLYKRKVRYNKTDGLYFMLDNRKYFEYEFEPCD